MPDDLETQLMTVERSIYSLREERDRCNARVREIIAQIKELTVKRDELNARVAELKKNRNEKHSKAKEIILGIKAVRDAIRKSGGFPASKELEELIEKLDFKYQTCPMELAREKALIKRIEELKRELAASKEMEKYQGYISKKSDEITKLKAEAQKIHGELLALVEESEKLHTSISARRNEVGPLRNKADKAHQDFIKLKASAAELKEKLVAARRKNMELRAKMMAEEAAERGRRLDERAETISKALKGKKKFNMRDLQILEKTGKALPLEFKK